MIFEYFWAIFLNSPLETGDPASTGGSLAKVALGASGATWIPLETSGEKDNRSKLVKSMSFWFYFAW